ncbi:MAG TPA: sigma-70 family RNA polymerase sigma factor [Pirellulaceae bacterium]|nr:sigma-70 family RNA polymerase sigma factor [Pirellulaceae bacterium]HMO90588.1 sigma-70 family RNA polymerase sigma factor [Pirellulaceae bacterium]HMP67833.1 sigma-70 family RNA polymerase sigma factor [Pirellulaceae bacterium]
MTTSPARVGQESDFDPAQLINEYQVGVWRYLRAMGCEASLAEDLTQETFLKVIQRPFTVLDPLATINYLRKIARNLYISHHRRAGKVIAVEDMQQFEMVWNEWVRDANGEAFIDALTDCFQRLTDRAKTALSLKFKDQLSRAEIAESIGLSEHGAKNLMQRAKKQLRDCVDRKVNSDGVEN